MRRLPTILLAITFACSLPFAAAAEEATPTPPVAAPEDATEPAGPTAPADSEQDKSDRDDEQDALIEELEERLDAAERHAVLDSVLFSGDYRFEAHTIKATVPAHFDGMQLQNMLVNTLFFFGANGRPPMSPDEVGSYIANNYGDYRYYTDNLTFEDIQQMMGQFPPELQQQLLGSLLPYTAVPGYHADNSVLYTNRLRLRLDAKVAENVSFSGRLAMYKVFGDSTGVQVFNGQPTSVNVDGTTVGVPNSDILRVERAYFSWNEIGGVPFYLSIGRRPSTEGAPLTMRNDEPRGGTPLGALINFQFDGITVGYRVHDNSTVRLCYGLGYESGFGSGDILKLPPDRLKDVHFLGLNWDIWDTEKNFVQITVARAFDVTDGFNGLIVLPNNPVTGEPIGAPDRDALHAVGEPRRHRPRQHRGHAQAGADGLSSPAPASITRTRSWSPRPSAASSPIPSRRPRSARAGWSTPAPATASTTRRPRSASSTTTAPSTGSTSRWRRTTSSPPRPRPAAT